MALVGLLVRARVRQRWRSWLLLCVLVALVSGLVLAAAASARRTATAFPRFEAAHGYDAFVLAGAPLPTMAALPGVVSATLLQSVSGGAPVGYMGIPFIGTVAIGAAAVFASQGELNIAAKVVLQAAVGMRAQGRARSLTAGVAEDATEAQVAGGGVDRLGLAGRWAVTQAVVGGAQVRSALGHAARDVRTGLTGRQACLR